MKKIGIVVTSRASYARIKTVLKAIRNFAELELFLVGSASLLLYKYGNAYQIIEKDGFAIDEKVYMLIEGENPATMAKSVGVGIMELATIFDNHKPDIVISIADRFETICTAIAASYLNIPVAHIQGGELTGSIDEKVRHAVTKFSSLHFVANEEAKQRVRQMGEPEESVFVTGCPSVDLANEVKSGNNFMNTEYLYSKYGGTGAFVDIDKDFLVVMQHSVTTEFEESHKHARETLSAVRETGIPAIVMWPNVGAGSDLTSKAIRDFREEFKPDNVHFFRNLEPEDFFALLLKSKCIVGNSSVGIRECSFLGVPAVNIGTRQEGRKRGDNVIDVSYSKNEIKKAVKKHCQNNNKYPSVQLYGDGAAGERIARILTEVNLSSRKRFAEWKAF
ncbi:UDP-N,N'-diacetylbacillosamine 2-epimerase (hydrolyzing) [subsurface metagenome]